jgi:hypothetical protein
MRQLLLPVARAPRRALLAIVAGGRHEWDRWLHDTEPAQPPAMFVRLCDRPRGREDAQPPDHGAAAAVARTPDTPLRRWPPAHPRRRAPWWRALLGSRR